MGLDLLQVWKTTFPSDETAKKGQLYKLYSNEAEAFLKIKQPEKTCEIYEKVVKEGIPMLNAKLCFRNAKGLLAQGRFGEALEGINDTLLIEPKHSQVLAVKQKVISKIEELENEMVPDFPSLADDSMIEMVKDKDEEIFKVTSIPEKVNKINSPWSVNCIFIFPGVCSGCVAS